MANNEISDALLIKSYIQGDESSLSVLIERHQAKIFGFIYSKIPDREVCNDIFQDTFMKVIKHLKTKSYNEEGKFLPWVMRIAHNLVIDYFRKNKKMPMQRDHGEYSIFSFLSDSNPTIESKIITEQIELDLNTLITELPLDQQEVIRMRFFQEMSFKEIAEATDVSINTALGRMRYALMNLRKVIEKNNIILTN